MFTAALRLQMVLWLRAAISEWIYRPKRWVVYMPLSFLRGNAQRFIFFVQSLELRRLCICFQLWYIMLCRLQFQVFVAQKMMIARCNMVIEKHANIYIFNLCKYVKIEEGKSRLLTASCSFFSDDMSYVYPLLSLCGFF